MTSMLERPRLLAVVDPMCSWCYGLAPSLLSFLKMEPELEFELVLGGLRPDPGETLTAEGIAFRLGHWQRVQALSGLSFNARALREGMRYSTEPISRAVVLARELLPQQGLEALDVLHALQRAFYVLGLDTTDERVLAEALASALGEQGLDWGVEPLLQRLRQPELAKRTRADFARARRLGVHSFPTLLIDVAGQIRPLHSGWAEAAALQRLWRAALMALEPTPPR